MQNDDPSLFLAIAPADRREVHFALAAVLASTALFIASLPYSTVGLAAVPAFIPAYKSALIVCDLITAVLLFGQFRFLRLPDSSSSPAAICSPPLSPLCTRSPSPAYSHPPDCFFGRYPEHCVALHRLARRVSRFCPGLCGPEARGLSRSGRGLTCQPPREQCDPGQHRSGPCFGLRGRGPGDRGS